jgi:hypothetical protein
MIMAVALAACTTQTSPERPFAYNASMNGNMVTDSMVALNLPKFQDTTA